MLNLITRFKIMYLNIRNFKLFFPPLMLLIASTSLIFYNEIKCTTTYETLEEAYRSVIVLNPHEPVRKELDGNLVYITAPLVINEPLTEPEYGISVQSVKLKRRVQMYQWVEETSTFPNVENNELTNYYYSLEWKDKLIDSDQFYIRPGHENPKDMPIKSLLQVSETVYVGPLKLSFEAKMKFDEFFEITGDERPERKDIKLHAGFYYHMSDIWNPEPGDLRIRFTYAGPSGLDVTVIGLQINGTIHPYMTTKGQNLLIVRTLSHNLDDMFSFEYTKISFQVWFARLCAWLLVLIAIMTFTDAASQRYPDNPFLRTLKTQDYSNIFISISWFLFITSLVWLWHKVLVGIGLIITAVIPIVFFVSHTGILDHLPYERM